MRSLAGALLLAAVVLQATAHADPVEVSRYEYIEAGELACMTWVRPADDGYYEWTTLCAHALDEDGDGTLDSRTGVAVRDLCAGDDPNEGSFCYGSELLAQGPLTADEFTFDLDQGRASLHASLGECGVDAAWLATGEPEHNTSSPLPDHFRHGVHFPSVWITVGSRDVDYVHRQGSGEADVCPSVGVSGAPQAAGLTRYRDANRTTTVFVDPTR